MYTYNFKQLVWDGPHLRLDSIHGRLLASVEQDAKWPSMWRVRLADENPTDMVNLSRARDAAQLLALAALNRPPRQPRQGSRDTTKPPLAYLTTPGRWKPHTTRARVAS